MAAAKGRTKKSFQKSIRKISKQPLIVWVVVGAVVIGLGLILSHYTSLGRALVTQVGPMCDGGTTIKRQSIIRTGDTVSVVLKINDFQDQQMMKADQQAQANAQQKIQASRDCKLTPEDTKALNATTCAKNCSPAPTTVGPRLTGQSGPCTLNKATTRQPNGQLIYRVSATCTTECQWQRSCTAPAVPTKPKLTCQPATTKAYGSQPIVALLWGVDDSTYTSVEWKSDVPGPSIAPIPANKVNTRNSFALTFPVLEAGSAPKPYTLTASLKGFESCTVSVLAYPSLSSPVPSKSPSPTPQVTPKPSQPTPKPTSKSSAKPTTTPLTGIPGLIRAQ